MERVGMFAFRYLRSAIDLYKFHWDCGIFVAEFHFESMHDILSREDVFLLVTTFYDKVRKDALLAPIFNSVITDWEHHLERLTNFWESNLFFKKTFSGDPVGKHIDVDMSLNGGINEMHFGVWLNLWYETIDELFAGEVAKIAKNRARSMSTFIHLKIFEARNIPPTNR